MLPDADFDADSEYRIYF
ncbi:unnamed protein product, partial [Rotaria sp. Silwood1]